MNVRPWLLVALFALLPACRHDDEGHQHANEHPEGHDHHAEGHGHGDTPMVRITQWSEQFELFMEHAPAVAGKEVELLAHVTVLNGFRPLESARCILELEGPARSSARAEVSKRPGTFTMKLKAGPQGVYRGRLRIEGAVSGSIEGIEIKVHADAEKASAAVPKEREGQYIELLKEQQWGVPFATAFVEKGACSSSLSKSPERSTHRREGPPILERRSAAGSSYRRRACHARAIRSVKASSLRLWPRRPPRPRTRHAPTWP
jgi:hypothetical protein